MPTFPDASTTTTTTTTTYSPDQIAAHNTETDCWLQIHNKVYDVTSYLHSHPGGADVILDAAGSDATGMFEDIGHSKGARRQLEKFQVGVSEVVDVVKVEKPVSSTDSSDSSSQLIFLFVALGGILVALVAWMKCC
jgi:cytochrome b involved in lipid metabolism